MYILMMLIATIVETQSYADNNHIKALITLEAVSQGVDPNLAIAVATVESNLNNHARGKAGEIGMFQVMPSTYSKDIYSVHGNIKAGVSVLKKYQVSCPTKENYTFVICYNQGNRHPRYPYLHPYFKKVMQAMR